MSTPVERKRKQRKNPNCKTKNKKLNNDQSEEMRNELGGDEAANEQLAANICPLNDDDNGFSFRLKKAVNGMTSTEYLALETEMLNRIKQLCGYSE